MKEFISLVFIVLFCVTVISAITVDGYAFLNNQSNHSGIEVLFERTVPDSLIVTAYTNTGGYYTVELENGIYNITYSKLDFHSFYLYDEILYSNTTFDNITLPEIPGIINVPSFYPNIQFAINESVTGDTVLVQSGTYVENINYNGKLITVGSLFLTTQDTSYIYSTTVDGNSSGTVVTFESGEDSTAVLCGFTITNGDADWGGGICCDSSSPSLTNVTISNNSASSKGGGIYCLYSNPILKEVTISDNYAQPKGGGIFCESNSSPSLTNVTISNNSASSKGGGIYCKSNSNPSLTNVTTSNNSSSIGGGIYCELNSSPSLTNATISNNSASSDGGGIYCDGSSPIITNCIVSNNTGYYGLFVNSGFPIINYSDFYNNDYGNFYGCGQWIGFNVTTNANGDSCDAYYNIQMNPCFVNPSNGNYNLLVSSPCIDAGIPDTTGLNLPPWDIIGNLRIWDGDGNGSAIIDMGAYEYGAPPFVDIDDNVIVQTPEVFLHQNYPNPFNPETTISYQLPENSELELAIYNLKGQLVKTLVNEFKPTGEHSAIWNGRDSNGSQVSSGVYFYKLNVNGKTEAVKKCLLLK